MPEYRYKNEDGRRRPDSKNAHSEPSGGKRMKVKAKDTPGVICIERHTHDEAIVISGSLVAEYTTAELREWISEELEKASIEIARRGGIAEQIKSALTEMTTCMISVVDEKASVNETQYKRSRITISAIVCNMKPEEAVDIVRKALAAVRYRLRQRK